jgi:hypothetical protein
VGGDASSCTWERLNSLLAESLESVMEGRWNHLMSEIVPLEARSPTRIIPVIKEVLAAVLPLILLISIKAARIRLPTQLDASWAIISVLWLFIYSIALLDPLYPSKVSSLRDLVESLKRSRD